MLAETPKVLIIEDDPDIQQLLAHHFQQAGYRIESTGYGHDGLSRAKERRPDLIVLDLMLPAVSGLEICRALKSHAQTRYIPIIILSAKSEEIDKVVGFELGVDDYVSKPFSPRELLLRAKAILRRQHKPSETEEEKPLVFGELTLDPVKHRVLLAQKEIELTAIEFKLLKHFLNTRGRVQPRDLLLDKVWGYDAFVTTRTVDTHVKRLREKLGPCEHYIETIRGTGYRFREKA